MISPPPRNGRTTWSSGSPNAWAWPRMTRAKAEDESPAADLVERLDRLGGDAGVAVEGGQDPGADLDPRCGGREGTGHRDALPEPLRRSLGWPPQQLIGHPDRVETDLLGAEGKVPDLDPARRWTLDEDVPRREHQADLERSHWTSGSGSCVLLACDHPARRSLDGQGYTPVCGSCAPRDHALPPVRTTPGEPGLRASWLGCGLEALLAAHGFTEAGRVASQDGYGVLRVMPTEGRRQG